MRFRAKDEKQDINVILDLWNFIALDGPVLSTSVTSSRTERQESHESIDVYATAMRALAATCEFGALKDEMIRDHLVYGITENSVQRKLLQEPKLSLENCLDICRSAEAPSAHSKAISGQSRSTDKPVDTVNALDKRRKSKAPPKRHRKGQNSPYLNLKKMETDCWKRMHVSAEA